MPCITIQFLEVSPVKVLRWNLIELFDWVNKIHVNNATMLWLSSYSLYSRYYPTLIWFYSSHFSVSMLMYCVVNYPECKYCLPMGQVRRRTGMADGQAKKTFRSDGSTVRTSETHSLTLFSTSPATVTSCPLHQARDKWKWKHEIHKEPWS